MISPNCQASAVAESGEFGEVGDSQEELSDFV
jgi:hypothetical protein